MSFSIPSRRDRVTKIVKLVVRRSINENLKRTLDEL